MLKDIKYIRMMKAVRYSMITVSLVLCFIPVSCQNGEPIPEQFSDEDAVTVRLNLSTRGVESGGSVMLDNYSSDPANWYKTGTLFPQAPAQPRIALMVFNKEQNRYVYSRLLPFSSGNAEGEYQTKVRIPKGESEFYAFYAPNQTGKDLPYYTPGGILQNAIPWDFLGEGMEEVDREDIVGAAFPAIIKEQDDGSLGIPVDNPYDGVTPSPSDEKIIDWTTTSMVAWEDAPGISNRLHMGMLSGKLTTTVQPASGEQVQDITVPLFRDFSRVRIYIASIAPFDRIMYDYKRIALLNFPVLMSPSFRENDSDVSQLARSTPGTGKNTEHTGTYSYGIKSETQLTIYEAPLNADGKVDYTKMDAQKYEQFFLPQYLAPYIPEANSWQKGQPHPKIQLTVEYHTGGDTSQGRTRTFLLDVGEESSPGVYSGPVYPNRDYKVFIVLPESSDREIIYRVESWNSKTVDFPPFQ